MRGTVCYNWSAHNLRGTTFMLATLLLEAAYWLIAFWLFAVGGAIGSFLNVVVYRVPRRMSLIAPGSHCPACKHPVRWFDNVPMLGWLLLRGKCRDCHVAISVRYPTVEAITATLFLVLGLVECLGGGANLPSRFAQESGEIICHGLAYLPRPWEVCGIHAYHLLLLCTLLAALLIEYDGHRVPVRLFVPAMAVGGVAPLILQALRPVPAFAGWSGWTAGLIDGMTGAAAGVALGWLAWRVCPRDRRHLGLVLGPACVGIFLGWQAAVAITLAAVAILLSLLFCGRWISVPNRLGPTTWLAVATLAWILAWRALSECFPGLFPSLA